MNVRHIHRPGPSLLGLLRMPRKTEGNFPGIVRSSLIELGALLGVPQMPPTFASAHKESGRTRRNLLELVLNATPRTQQEGSRR